MRNNLAIRGFQENEMNKLDMATQILLKLIETNERGYDPEGIAGYAWEIADAMQAEADKREPKGFPEVLQPEVDWRLAPEWAEYHAFRADNNTGLWCINMPTVTSDCILSNGACSPAPSFGFTESHVMERPQ